MSGLSRRRELIAAWLSDALEAIEPRRLTARALSSDTRPAAVIAIGKAAAAMSWGAADALEEVSGLCVTNAASDVPPGIELIVADHPVPGPASFEAGRRVLEFAAGVQSRCVALISGGGSALCESPLPGIAPAYLQTVNETLLAAGASIADTNLVRRHLSAIKRGGIANAVDGIIESYLISDVAASDPGIIASGPTIPAQADPEAARALMVRYGLEVDSDLWQAMRSTHGAESVGGPVTVIADGRIAGQAVVDSALDHGIEARLLDGWIEGALADCLNWFFQEAGTGLTVAAGEPNLEVTGDGVGGRNSHAALLTALRIHRTDAVFAAFATDGVDGKSSAAGAIVDGATIDRGGDPSETIRHSDSARYLELTDDLINTGPTGTNVSDLWVLWKD